MSRRVPRWFLESPELMASQLRVKDACILVPSKSFDSQWNPSQNPDDLCGFALCFRLENAPDWLRAILVNPERMTERDFAVLSFLTGYILARTSDRDIQKQIDASIEHYDYIKEDENPDRWEDDETSVDQVLKDYLGESLDEDELEDEQRWTQNFIRKEVAMVLPVAYGGDQIVTIWDEVFPLLETSYFNRNNHHCYCFSQRSPFDIIPSKHFPTIGYMVNRTEDECVLQ